MEPKFQSSFIPKGPAAASPLADAYSSPKNTFFGFMATVVFVLSLLAAIGVFGYERYLLSKIGTMGDNLTAARQSLKPDTISTLVRVNNRIIATRDLLNHHTAVSPFFDYLDSATIKNVRFTGFSYIVDGKGAINITMQGTAKSYADVALQSDAFNKASFIKNPVFSDLTLDGKGNVTFTFHATLDPAIVSYLKNLPASAPIVNATATSTATSTAAQTTATTTKPVTATSTSSH